MLDRSWLALLALVLFIGTLGGASSRSPERTVDRIAGRWHAPPRRVPSAGVPDGPVLGNGGLGAVATWGQRGDDQEVAFHFGHNDFFAAPTLGVSSCGYASAGGGRKALGGLGLRFRGRPGLGLGSAVQWPSNASAAVTVETAEGLVVVKAFLHATEDVLLVEVSAAAAQEVTVTLWTYSGCSGERKPIKGSPMVAQDDKWIALSCTPMTDRLHTEAGAGWSGLRVSRANGWPYQSERFAVQWFSLFASVAPGFMRGVGLPGCEDGRGPCAQGFVQVQAQSATVISVSFARRSLHDEPPTSAPQYDLAAMWSSHLAWWDGFWNKSAIELVSSPATEFFWYMSQYLLGSSSGGDAAPGIFGPFVVDDEVSWMGDLTLNYNAEATYYGAAAANHLEVFLPYFQSILDYLPAAVRLALEREPGCKGALYFPGHILPRGVTSSGKGDMGQKQMGLFATVPFILYWRYTRDLAFAKRALPLLLGVARFWECSLSMGADGRLHDANDCAEELCIPDGDVQPDPTIVLSLLPALFVTLVEVTGALGTSDSEQRRGWSTIAQRVAPYPTMVVAGESVIVDFLGGEGIPIAWSGLFAAFPFGTIEHDGKELALRSLSRFFRVWPGGKQGNSFVHAFPAAARLGWQPARLFSMWEAYLQNTSDTACCMYPNGFVLACGGTGLENVGATAYVHELMLQTRVSDGALHLFPTLPAGLAASFRQLRAEGGFLVSARISIDGRISGLDITAPRSISNSGAAVLVPPSVAVVDPWSAAGGVLVNGAAVPVVGGVVHFGVRPGGSYTLEAAAAGGAEASQALRAEALHPGAGTLMAADSTGRDRFQKLHRDVECLKGVGGEAAHFTLGGGGHSREACMAACEDAKDCFFITYFHGSGYCHMFESCGEYSHEGDGSTIYSRL